MMSNKTCSTLYIGVTNNLLVRVSQHRRGEIPGFTRDYHCTSVVYCAHFRDIPDAIAREKQLKGWRRAKKNALIAQSNPHWNDLAAEWFK
jgi:putative endonuclease